jgi:hypothetical protein
MHTGGLLPLSLILVQNIIEHLAVLALFELRSPGITQDVADTGFAGFNLFGLFRMLAGKEIPDLIEQIKEIGFRLRSRFLHRRAMYLTMGYQSQTPPTKKYFASFNYFS